jgi:hypothetical protein
VKTIQFSRFNYTERTKGVYRDLRQMEVKLPKRRFARISINGQYLATHSGIKAHRYANPGWSLGSENCFVHWTHFHRHCWHLSFTAFKRGVTFSYGKRVV